jgi:hypothetical protein
MKLVLTYTGGDGCTYSFDETIPFNYSSKEEAEADFLGEAEKGLEKQRDFCFLGKDYGWSYFFYRDPQTKKMVYFGPEFFTIEEWFDQHSIN